jgi:hypothetical protein
MSTDRRRFLRLCGVAGLGAIAGCSGGSEDGETTADDETPADAEAPANSETTTEATGTMEPAAKIVADDGHSRDLFGGSVAMSSDSTTALVGASEEDSNGENSGSAYAFQL